MRKYFLVTIILLFIIISYLKESFIKNDIYAQEANKSILDQIEYNNFVYKDRVFGNPFRGLSMSIAPEKKEYEVGEEIEIRALFKNISQAEIELRQIGSGENDYRYGLYLPDGSPVPKSEYAENFEAHFKERPPVISRRGGVIKPRDIIANIVLVGRYFKIEKEGIYFLVMMRRISESWEDGFLISNMTKINIISKKEK
jgi:hypothetical protein